VALRVPTARRSRNEEVQQHCSLPGAARRLPASKGELVPPLDPRAPGSASGRGRLPVATPAGMVRFRAAIAIRDWMG